MKKTECLAMILAGGQGSRLGALTQKIAKPAVHFGGKYRIIDFPLSNCTNSGIETVGVLTQYKPLELHRYLGTGEAWNLDRKNGGIYILPPYAREKSADWYRGTADAIYQNINFIDSCAPDYVLVLSGDHIYTMDYSWMLEEHKMNKAEATISVIKVPLKEASRFGIMTADKTGRITAFEEKPKNPQSNLASMGIYIFNWSLLRSYLEADAEDNLSAHDFGKNIIPKMLKNKVRLFSYAFNGYWKDVGTIESLWQANMDLLNPDGGFTLDSSWRIYSAQASLPPHFIGKHAKLHNCLISGGAIINGVVDNSIIFPGVHIKEGSHIIDSVIMPFSIVHAGATIRKAILAPKCEIMENSCIGNEDNSITVIAESMIIDTVNSSKQVG